MVFNVNTFLTTELIFRELKSRHEMTNIYFLNIIYKTGSKEAVAKSIM